jgi:RNA polymerase-binding transcription factor
MNKDQTADFKKRLVEKQQQLRRGLERSADGLDETTHDFGRDEADRANASQAKELTFLQSAQGRSLMTLVESALARIGEGTFGDCLSCGQEISLPRLKAVPWSRYCITCQELIEKHGSAAAL